MIKAGDALLLVDLQNYYLQPQSDFFRYSEASYPGAMNYISGRWREVVEARVRELLSAFRAAGNPIIFLRLCGREPDRSDLHAFFQESFHEGRRLGYPAVYPLETDAAAGNPESIAPGAGEAIFSKTTFSGFHSGGLVAYLAERKRSGLPIERLVVTGLATSQCVDTTARDASDYGYRVVLIEDALADYSETAHMASLFASQAVCGGDIRSAAEFLNGVPDPKK
ncbi:MAG: isochorismatase family cysteine hydrolase, partial [Leptospirales bacterium]